MILPPLTRIDQRDTHRLINAAYIEDETVLRRISDDDFHLDDIFALDSATSGRLLAQDDKILGIGREELVFGIPNETIINAAFTYASPEGSRFNSSDRGAWYAGIELETSQAEVAYHRNRHYLEIKWDEPEQTRYLDMRADFIGDFHDCRGEGFENVLSPTSYAASQALAASLLASGSLGVVYPSVRFQPGSCLACFRPALVGNLRRGKYHFFNWEGLSRKPFWTQ